MLLSVEEWEKFKNQVRTELVPRLFISYAHEDRSFVERLVNDLKAHRVRVWVDFQEMRVGDLIMQRVNQGIEESDYFLIVLSPDSLQFQWVQEELNSGFIKQISERKTQILPVLWRNAELPLTLRTRYYADFRRDYESGLKRLIEAIENDQTAI